MTPEEQKEHEARVDAQAVDAATKLAAWLETPHAQQQLRNLDRQYFDEFKAADTDDKRSVAWFRANAYQTFLDEIKATQNAGKVALARQNSRREQEARAARNPRRS